MDFGAVSKIIATLKESVKCPICLDCIKNCAQLQCGHEFCKECIDEHWKSTTTHVCPMCKKPIKKRQKPNQNWFVNDLGNFIISISDLLTKNKESFADDFLDVSRPSTSKDKALTVISNNVENKENAFDKLMGDTRRCYVNKRKPKLVTQPILHFQDSDTRNNIINWLNDASEKLDSFSQKPQHLQELEPDKRQGLDLPATPNRVRSQSLNVNDKIKKPLFKRYQSLTEYFDDYTIEEINSEQIIQQVERKVIQDMLEDECLNNLDDLAREPVTKSNSAKKKPNKQEEKKVSQTNSLNAGWERINCVKKTIKKAAKLPKKLNISLQSEGKEETQKKSKRKRGKSKEQEISNETKKQKAMNHKTINNKKSSVDKTNEIKEPDLTNTPKENKTFNLSTVEKYFLQNMTYLEVNVSKHSSDLDSPLRVSRRNSKKGSFRDLETEPLDFAQPSKDINNKLNEENDEDDIFSMPTQKADPPKSREFTPEHAKYDELFHSKFDFVPKLSESQNSIDNVLQQLGDNLERCVQRTLDIDNPIPNSLIDCFLNLKSYVERVQEIRNCKEDRGTQVFKKVCHVEVQTKKLDMFDQSVQTSEILYRKNLHNFVDKNIQTSQKYIIDRACNTKDMQTEPPKESQIATSPKSPKLLFSNTSSPIVASQKSQNDLISKKTHLDTPVLNSIIENMDLDDNQSTKVCEKDKDKSQDSVVICTAPSTNIPKKINRKINFGDSSSTQKKFKRIKRPASDDSDDDNKKKGSKQFLRDDLTIKFVDTESNDMDIATEKTPDNFDYDEYLDEVMQKYGNSPKNKPVEIINNKEKTITNKTKIHTSQLAGPSNVNGIKNAQKNKKSRFELSEEFKDSLSSRNVKKGKFDLDLQKKSMSDEFEDHIFTADIAFQENLEKFDHEIAEHCNTESNEIVENTPIDKVVMLKSKTSSGKYRNNKKLKDLPEIQIISKNKAIIKDNQKKNTPDEVKEMLEDIKNDASFFKTNMESQIPQIIDKHPPSEILFKNTEATERQKSINNSETCYEATDEEETINEKRKEPLIIKDEEIFEQDDLIEAELDKISFTAEQKKLEEMTRIKVNVLQNIKVKSQNKGTVDERNVGPENDEVDDSGGEDLVDKTPEKKEKSSDRSVMTNINQLLSPQSIEFIDNHFDDDICLPPPPGFSDDFDSKTPEKKNAKSPTQVPLTEMIVTPETCISPNSIKQSDKQTIVPFNLSLVIAKTPRISNGSRHSTPRSQFKELESLNFSPIIKNTQTEKPQSKLNPIVSKLTSKKTLSLMTSAPNQRSILNYIKPSQEVSPMPQKPKPCITTSRLINKDMSCFTQLEVKKLITVSNTWNSNVTHLVVLVDAKGRLISHTAKYLLALSQSAWVVRYEWAQDCARQGRIVPEEPYEVIDQSGIPGPKIARLTRETNLLLKNYRFFCPPPFQIIPRADLEVVIKNLGGEIVKDVKELRNDDDKIGLVLTDTTATEEMDVFEELLEKYRVVTVDVEWITKCVGQYKLASVRPYLLCSDENVHDLGYPVELVETVPFTFMEGTTLGQ